MQPIWKPSANRIASSNIAQFMKKIEQKYTVNFFDDYFKFYDWTIDNNITFWKEVASYFNIIGDINYNNILKKDEIFYKNKFFPDTQINYSENLLQHQSDDEAIVFKSENGSRVSLSFNELKDEVAKYANSLRKIGIKKGDCVAGVMHNSPDAIIGMLATVSIGAIWSVCSPDFGTQGILDRFQQISPKVLFVTDGYYFKGKLIDIRDKIQQVVKNIDSIKKVVINPYVNLDFVKDDLFTYKNDFINDNVSANDLVYERVEFNHPLFIMFSSGTTGLPKCIVHGHGGTLLQHMKEHQLHSDIKPNDRVFFFTTCGWMMWNWLVSALASKATVMLYDGSPLFPDSNVLFDYLEDEKITFLGVGAKYIDAIRKMELSPIETHDLSRLRTIASTASPLVQESFEYVYTHVSKDVNLASISGGTDILSCFALGCPIVPVYSGELQVLGLGMKVEVLNDSMQQIKEEKGELVCTLPFPSMPVMFWNDKDDVKFHKAYFDRFDNIWCHGDFVEITKHKGVIIYGRSDTILNPNGIRIGTSEIYRQVEQLHEVLDSIAVGQKIENDIRIILFVKLKDGIILNDQLINKIKNTIKNNASPRHVPSVILTTQDIPRTLSGKIVETAVANMIHNEPVKNKESLANPESLKCFKNRDELVI